MTCSAILLFRGRVTEVSLSVITLTVALILYKLFNATAGDAYHIGKAALPRREPTGLSSLGVGSSPWGGHSLSARYPETLTSETQTYPPVEPGARRRFGCAERAAAKI